MKGLVVCLVLALAGRSSAQQVFDATAQVGGIRAAAQQGPQTTAGAINTALSNTTFPLTKPGVISKGQLPRECKCGTVNTDTRDIQSISDTFCAGGGASGNKFNMSNLVWAWGQFIDHELVGAIDDESGPTFVINLANNRQMPLHRVRSQGGPCPDPMNIHNGVIDGAVVYSSSHHYTQQLRVLPGCKLKEGDQPGFLPITGRADENGRFHMVAGEGRVDEHAVLTSMHTLWLREHNRLCDAQDPELQPDTRFFRAKAVVTAKMQQITMKGFLPILGIYEHDLDAAVDPDDHFEHFQSVSVEFSMAYRLGHTMLPDKMGNISLHELFDGQKNFLNEKAAGGVGYRADANAFLDTIFNNLASTEASEMDGKISDSLRNILFGQRMQEDLCARNIFRGREMAMPSYAAIATCFGQTPNAKVQQETPDIWLGLIREPRKAGQPLGPTLKAVLVEQFGRTFFGPRGSWWKKDEELQLRTRGFHREIEATTLAQVISQNTGAKVTGDAFKA